MACTRLKIYLGQNLCTSPVKPWIEPGRLKTPGKTQRTAASPKPPHTKPCPHSHTPNPKPLNPKPYLNPKKPTILRL